MALVLAGALSAQGDTGFLRGAGNLDLVVNYGLDTYDSFWIGSKRIEDAPFGRVDRHSVSLYGAYGLTDRIDLSVNFALVSVNVEHVFPDDTDLQDFTAQAKVLVAQANVLNGQLSMEVSPGLKAPLSHYENNAVNAIGDDQVDLRFRGIVQWLHSSSFFVAFESGYDVRLSDPPDEVPINVTAGLTLFERLTMTAWYSHIESLGGYDIGEGPFAGVEEDLDRIGLGAYLRLDEHLGITANGWTTLDGTNTGDISGFSVGIVLNLGLTQEPR